MRHRARLGGVPAPQQERGRLTPFPLLQSPLLAFKRTAGVAFAYFTLSEENKRPLVEQDALPAIVQTAAVADDRLVERDCALALANITDTIEYGVP